MKSNSRNVVLRSVLPLLCLLLALTLPSVLGWQNTGNQDNENRLLLPNLEREELKRSPSNLRSGPRLAVDQITEDFRQLQLLNNQVRMSAANQVAGNRDLIKPLGDIRKRAKRLRTNLVLGNIVVEQKSLEPTQDVDLQTLLSSLDQSVRSFVRNPMFRSTHVVDVGLARSAKIDIERVIELSQVIANRIRKETR